jgi:PAS domain-containing protein
VIDHLFMNIGQFYEARPSTVLWIGIEGEDRGRILMASATLGELLRCPPGEFVGSALDEFIHPDDQRRATCALARLIRRRSTTFDGVGRLLDTYGEVHWLSVHASLITTGSRELLRVCVLALPLRLPSSDDDRGTSGRHRVHAELDVGQVPSPVAA